MWARALLGSVMLVSATANAKPQPAPDTSAVPGGFVEMFVLGVITTESGPAVVLRAETDPRVLPIWIGPSEALAIELRHSRQRFQRPLTHDLLDRMLSELGGEVVKVHIDGLAGHTYLGTVFLKTPKQVTPIDARPSDAIALALGSRAPIYVQAKVLDRAGLSMDSVARQAPAEQPRAPPAGQPVITEL